MPSMETNGIKEIVGGKAWGGAGAMAWVAGFASRRTRVELALEE